MLFDVFRTLATAFKTMFKEFYYKIIIVILIMISDLIELILIAVSEKKKTFVDICITFRNYRFKQL